MRDASAVQVGVYLTGANQEFSTRSQIGEPSSFVHGHYPRFYWIGESFPDGYFIQTGYFDSQNTLTGLCDTGFSTFTTILYNDKFVDGYGAYNATHCNLTGAHNFRLGVKSSGPSGTVWHAYMDGDPIGPDMLLPEIDYQVVRYRTTVKSEISNCDTSVHPGCGPDLDASTPFPTVDYGPAIEFQHVSGGSYSAANYGYSYVTGPEYHCTWFTEYDVSVNDFATGKPSNLPGTTCYGGGEQLW